MSTINIEDLQPFVSESVQVSISDLEGEDQAPFLAKKIDSIRLCPDNTHLRIYFDRLHFLAVPLTAAARIDKNEWSAFDEQTGLQYVIRKEREENE